MFAVAHGWDFEDDDFRHTLPQKRVVTDSDGRLLVDFLGRYETLHADFSRVCAKLGVADLPLPRVNHQRGRDHYSRYYTSATRDHVARLFQEDVELFGYQFEEPLLDQT